MKASLPIIFSLALAQHLLAATDFAEGVAHYRGGEYVSAQECFAKASRAEPSSAAFHNLASSCWQLGEVGPAILNWEQALWLDPFNRAAQQSLRYARKSAQVEIPELSWYEVVSTWLPANAWAWLTSLTIWLAVAVLILPGIMGRRRLSFQHATAALLLTCFLLTLPAQLGIWRRSNLVFILETDTPLRLTPTEHAQIIARMGAGEPARIKSRRGRYFYVQTGNRGRGWVTRENVGFLTEMR